MIVTWRVNSFKESYLMSIEDCMNPCLEGLESNRVDLTILITIKYMILSLPTKHGDLEDYVRWTSMTTNDLV